MSNKKQSVIHYLVLFIFIVLAYWQVSFFQYSLKWDTAEQYFPWRFYLGECLRNGHLPLWNPYEMCGYPFYADPQSCAWYPVSLLIGSTTGYSIFMVEVEFILSIFIGSIGVYQLIKYFQLSPQSSLFAALSYSACGFFIGNAQHLTWIVSAAWIPWALHSYLYLLKTRRTGFAILTALFLYLLLSGGYPAFITVLLYLFILLFIIHLLIEKNKKDRIQLIKQQFILFVCFLIMSIGVIISFTDAQPYINRGQGISIESANSNPFSPQSAISFLLPFTSFKNDALFKTDISMSNAYFGIIGILLLAMALINRKNKTQWFIIFISVILLCISFGPYLPVRKWLYEYIPLMNMFRFPSLFRLFFIIGFITLSAFAFDRLVREKSERQLFRLKMIASFFIVLFASITFYSLYRNHLSIPISSFKNNLREVIWKSSFYDHAVIQSIIQLIILILFTIILFYRKASYFTAKFILAIVMVDLFLATQLNMYATVVYSFPAGDVHQKVKDLPKGFPIPDQVKLVSLNDAAYNSYTWPLNSNLNIFHKQTGTDGYNPFVLKNYEALSDGPFKDSVWQNPLIYFSEKIISKRNITGTTAISPTTLIVEENDFNALSKKDFKTDSEDQAIIESFGPNKMMLKVHSENEQLLTIQQTYFKGREVFIDGKKIEPYQTNFCYSSMIIPSGDHRVEFVFQPIRIMICYMISASAFLLAIASCIIFRKKLF